jgi:hypothetical protein
MTQLWSVLLAGALAANALVAHSQADTRQGLIVRAKSLELNTPYVPPPGDPLEHYASGYAKIMCSSIFVTRLDPAFAIENVGYFTALYAERAKLGTPKIDREKRTVHVTMPNGTVRIAKQVGSQGCVTLPIGKTDVFFKPSIVKSALPDSKTQPWPMGDVLPAGDVPAGIDHAKIQQAVEAAFDPAGMTAAFVVTFHHRPVGRLHRDVRTAPAVKAGSPTWVRHILAVLLRSPGYTGGAV